VGWVTLLLLLIPQKWRDGAIPFYVRAAGSAFFGSLVILLFARSDVTVSWYESYFPLFVGSGVVSAVGVRAIPKTWMSRADSYLLRTSLAERSAPTTTPRLERGWLTLGATAAFAALSTVLGVALSPATTVGFWVWVILVGGGYLALFAFLKRSESTAALVRLAYLLSGLLAAAGPVIFLVKVWTRVP
jgi:hypothetical protein